MTFREQVLTLQRFKRGDINCLFATPVAEEGIDIPECDLVIRFDLYNSVIQYLQSKGRARKNNSRYINMVEEGNTKQLRSLHQANRDATTLRMFCSALPEDRKLQDQAIDTEAAARFEEAGQKIFEIPETGARLTFPHSLEVLARFVSSMSPSETSYAPEYIITSYGSRFQADVVLPDSSPIKSMQGYAQRNKMLARCSAAFETCVKLVEKGYIDNHLQSKFAKKIPAMRNARLAVSDNRRSEYNMLLKPKMWSDLGADVPLELAVAVIFLLSPNALERHTRPLLLLSRRKLPELPDIPLYFGNGLSSLAKCKALEKPLRVTADEIAGLTKFTLQTFKDVFSKVYEAGPTDLPYFLAPCIIGHEQAANGEDARVDWDVVKFVEKNEVLKWGNAPEEFFFNKFVTDPQDGGRKLIINGINKSLKPSDPTPQGVAEHKNRGYKEVEKTIKQYSNSFWLQSRRRLEWRDDQPVVNAEVLPLRRNFLDEYQVQKNENSKCFVILEPLRVSPVSHTRTPVISQN